ncbi:MAG: phage tail family protein [Clostridiales bacterium]|nr:phage tail family protein [Clostridiales bacterium]
MPDITNPWVNLTLDLDGRQIEIGKRKTYELVSVDGLESPDYELDTTAQAMYDGDVYKGGRVAGRTITIEADYRDIQTARARRQELISFFRPRTKGRLTVDYMGSQRYIDCYVNSFKCSRSNLYQPLGLIVSLYCPHPYFFDVKGFSKNMAAKLPLMTVPFAVPMGQKFALSANLFQSEASIVNPGDKETGFTVRFAAARGEVVNPAIRNLSTGELIRVNYTMPHNSSFVINTTPGSKTILYSGEYLSSILENQNWTYRMDWSTTFFQLQRGENVLQYDADSGYTNLDVFLNWNAEYLGV